jgi:MYXO-CTERM domain-containing protein
MPSPLRTLPVLLALVASPVLAQTDEDLTLSLSQNPFELVDETYYVSIDGCAGQFSGEFTLVGAFEATFENASLRLTFTNGDSACEWDTFGSGCDLTQVVDDEGIACICLKESASADISVSTALDQLFAATCEDLAASALEFRWRFFTQYLGSNLEGEVALDSTSVDLIFDFRPPAQPAAAPTVVAVENGLEVTFPEVSGGDAAKYEVCYKAEGAQGAAAGATGNAARREGYTCTSGTPGQSKRLSGLQNGVVYSVVYATVDAAGNRSANSPAATGTPEESFDFAEWYRSRNGPATGGCAQVDGAGSGLWALGLLGLVALRRRRRVIAGLALIAAPGVGQAEETERTAAVQLRAGSFLPDIDKTFPTASCKASGQCPYEAVFQNDDPLMLMLVVDKHLVVDYGTLSVGAAFGYWNVEGKALLGAGQRAADTTELTVMPIQAQVTYRLDLFQDYLPVVPVVRGGLDYYYWRVLDGEGEVTSFEPGDKAEGGTFGWHFSVGAHILLDFFSPDMASDFDRDVGVNNSYLTIEYQQSDITGFGSSESLRLGSEVLFFGLALDM